MKDFFQSQQRLAKEKEEQAKKKVDRYAMLRLAAFVLTGASLWAAARENGEQWYYGVSLVFFILFLTFMRLQQSAQRLYRFYKNMGLINRDEEQRLSYEFLRDDKGTVFADSRHFYSGDLDIFGKHSLYRLLDRTQTGEGSARLAEWLTQPAPLETILERQGALSESRNNHDWRQNWQATALLHQHATQNIGVLKTWITTPLEPTLAQNLRLKWWTIVTLLLVIGWITGLLPFWPAGFSLVAHIVLIRRYSRYLRELTDQTTHIGATLSAYADLASLARGASFQGKWWTQQLNSVREAEMAFRDLGNWFTRLDFRANIYFALFAGIPLLWDLICLDALEKWKKKYGSHFAEWLDSLANIEAMNSLAGHAFAHPNQILPEVHWGNELDISCTGLGHPLIQEEKRICNDFTLSGTGQTVLITGSNMSGKSTFLRTLGINLVLAQAGSVVTAKSMSCSLMQVFTSMRTQDSLEENTSSFYAELKRLRQLIELASSKKEIPVFYLLDEILKGTNSADRHRGAAALIRQLHPLAASGLVSTHDLELGIWGDSQSYVQNLHFRSDLIDGEITFDYLLSPGTCSSFNASELMRMMGIKIEANGEN